MEKNIPTEWGADRFSSEPNEMRNLKWSVPLGTVGYTSPVVANGRIFVGTNNQGEYLPRLPKTVDLSCLLCFEEQNGKFLWQHSNKKLPTGRVHDWPFTGIVSTPYVDGDRLWYVNNRGEVVCLDTAGFTDGMNDGPFKQEDVVANDEADVVWKFDMMAKLGTRQHNMCTCSLTGAGDTLFVVTGNGVDESHIHQPAPDAPAFLALDRNTAKVLWTDNSPGKNVLHGSWSSPSYAVLGGQPQVLFPGGDGWLYSFDPKGDGQGNSKLLWKFDCNPKRALWRLGGRGGRNPFVTLPVIYDQKVYVATGQDIEHGEGLGRLWCIDPTVGLDGSDVSPTVAFDVAGKQIKSYRQSQSVDVELPNPKSAAVWKYEHFDMNGDGQIDFEETMHRSCGGAAIKDGLLFIADHSGLFHCVDAATGKPHWTHDMQASVSAISPLIVDGKVYIGDEDGDITIFKLAKQKEVINEPTMNNAVYSTPVVAGNVLFINSRNTLYAIATADSKANASD